MHIRRQCRYVDMLNHMHGSKNAQSHEAGSLMHAARTQTMRPVASSHGSPMSLCPSFVFPYICKCIDIHVIAQIFLAAMMQQPMSEETSISSVSNSSQLCWHASVYVHMHLNSLQLVLTRTCIWLYLECSYIHALALVLWGFPVRCLKQSCPSTSTPWRRFDLVVEKRSERSLKRERMASAFASGVTTARLRLKWQI